MSIRKVATTTPEATTMKQSPMLTETEEICVYLNFGTASRAPG
ncbi:MAG: hypothetical protein M0Z67_15715 [Nitrospiraceae bacterium]|nr:hypothetical protein [Nitrospiraceae bacterium]